MVKLNQPLISLGASGTVGDRLTFQKSRGQYIARSKPTPANPRSLAQMYQRWLYQDYSTWWTEQSAETKQSYQTAGSRFHLTGFQYWMKLSLKLLPYHIAIYHLDYISGGLTPDFSRNSNTGTVYGATLVDGVIGKAFRFDGLDDYINCGNGPSFNLKTQFTFEVTIRTTQGNFILSKDDAGAGRSYQMQLHIVDNRLSMQLQGVDVPAVLWIDATALRDGNWHRLSWRYTGSRESIWVDGVSMKDRAQSGSITVTATPFLISGWALPGIDEPFNGTIDNVIVYNVPLSDKMILDHSQRRYPL